MIPVLVIVAIVLLAGVLVAATMRRREQNVAVGHLSRETISRDRGRVTITTSSSESGRDVERLAEDQRRRSVEVVESKAVDVEWAEPDADQVGLSRRQFLNRSVVGVMGLNLSGFGLAVLSFLWPPFITGFGAKINVGKVSDIVNAIRDAGGFLYRPDGRMWLTEYPAGAIEKARTVYTGPELAGMQAGVIALFQKCPHLGCRVPECLTSQWFECPCHGSKYNRVGEKRGGPAPRGMDRFAMSVSADGVLTVDTGNVIQGPPIGTNTTGQEAEGPNCIGEATH